MEEAKPGENKSGSDSSGGYPCLAHTNGEIFTASGNAGLLYETWDGRDQRLFQTCMKYNVQFDYPKDDETIEDTKARRENLQRKCKAARERQKRLEMSPESRNMLRAKQAERMRRKRRQMSDEQRRLARKQQAEKMKDKRKSLSSEQLQSTLAHRAKTVRDARRKTRLLKLKADGNHSIKSAIAAGLDADDLKLFKTEHELKDDSIVEVIDVVMEENACDKCGKRMHEQKTPSEMFSNDTFRIFNFGYAPVEIVEKFQTFCQSYHSLSEALLDLLEKERHLYKRYSFISHGAKRKILGVATSQDYPDVLLTTIRALKELTKNCKYVSVACTIEELLSFSETSENDIPTSTNKISLDTETAGNELAIGAFDEVGFPDESVLATADALHGVFSSVAGETPPESSIPIRKGKFSPIHQDLGHGELI